MQAALTAAERGHNVTLCEAGDRLGGQLNYEEFVPFKKELYDFSQQLAKRMKKAGVNILLNTKVTKEWAEEFNPDAIIAAVGADHIIPAIPGIDNPKVKFLTELRKSSPDFGKRVVVLGGGLVGCETAIHLHQQGKDVTVVEMCDDFAVDATMWHKHAIRIQFKEGVDLQLNTKAVAINEEGVVVEDKEGNKRTIPADTVFCAVGMRSRSDELESLRYTVPTFFSVGDCNKPGQIFDAVSGGHYAGLNI